MQDINLYNIKTYYLNSTNKKYKDKHVGMEKMLKKFKFNNYERFPFNFKSSVKTKIDRHNACGSGHIALTKYAINKNIYPFIILEDDAHPIYHFEGKINLPKEANIFYLGSSTYGTSTFHPQTLALKNFDRQYYRIFGSLTTHALLIPDKQNAQIYLKIISEAVSKNLPIDSGLAMNSSNLKFLTPKKGPYFYQTGVYEKFTRFSWTNNKENYLVEA